MRNEIPGKDPFAECRQDFDNGECVTIQTPDGLIVFLQKQEGKLKAGIIRPKDSSSESFNDLVFKHGGLYTLVQEALNVLGVAVNAVPGSGELTHFQLNASSNDVTDHFKFKG